tara:strand:- start:2100 stop:3116 length:1017 start_codon:yes stop_codon:yes gene_type:complete
MDNYNREIQLKDIIITLTVYKNYLLQRKIRIILFSLLFSIIGIISTFFLEDKYKANLTFVVEEAKAGNSIGAMSGIASQFGFDLGGSSSETFSQKNIMQLLKSRVVVESTLLRQANIEGSVDLLIHHFILQDKIFANIDFNQPHVLHHDSVIGEIWKRIIENDLSIEIENDEANIITLSYISVNEHFAKSFAETLINEMSKMYISHQTKQARNTIDFLQDRADSVFIELERVEHEFARIKDINQRIVKASGRLQELQLMREVEVLNTMYLEIIKNLEISKMTLLNRTPIIQIIDKPILPLENANLSITILTLLGAILGFLISVLYYIIRKLFNDTLDS